jgi:hypothetical protein
MLSNIAVRFTKDDIAKINEEVYRRMQAAKAELQSDRNDNEGGGVNNSGDTGAGECGSEPENKGKLILDATAAPADIRYPTDLSLLNECREGTEKIIDDVWDKTEREGYKTAYNRQKARKVYLKVAKQRKPRKKQ